MNNNKTRGISGLSILLCVLVLAGVYWFMSQSGVQQTAYTYQDFQKDLKKEKVESVDQAEQSRTDRDIEDPVEE